MGNWFSWGGWWTKNEKISILGLDGSGKTSLFVKLKLGEITTLYISQPVHIVQYRKMIFSSWDVGVQVEGEPENTIYNFERPHIQGITGLIWLADSNNQKEIENSKKELFRILQDDQLDGVPLLVFANKQDLLTALSGKEVADKLGLHSLIGRAWHIEEANITGGNGIYEGLDWLSSALKGEVAPNQIQLNVKAAK